MIGFNSEVKHRGATFHVQTQDMGIHSQCIESLVYKEGKLLVSRKEFYASFLNTPDLKEKIRLMMERLHKAVLKEIHEGKFDHHLSPHTK